MRPSSRWRVKNDDLPTHFHAHNHCLHQALPKELGEGYSDIFQLDTDLSYIETHYTPSKDLGVLSHIDSQEPRMVVTLGLKGQSCFTGHHGEELVFNQGYTSIATFNSSMGERQYQAHQPVTQLRLSLSKKWLDRYFGEAQSARLFNTEAMQLLRCQPISTQGMVAARQLLTANFAPEMRRVFMHAQAMSLLASELSCLYQEQPLGQKKFTERDKNIARLAHDILQQEFQRPPSVAELARRAGTNQFKLKRLFQHYFNNTPYGVLLDIRMNKAYQLLSTTHCHVSIAADVVGYSHANNFSAAFVKYFGTAPKVIAKQ
ncbi:MAG: AraC family transcriptional regulator [Methylococcales bacterium]|nr:AraC family transcriptional regulator [Methylococcales bacterium]